MAHRTSRSRPGSDPSLYLLSPFPPPHLTIPRRPNTKTFTSFRDLPEVLSVAEGARGGRRDLDARSRVEGIVIRTCVAARSRGQSRLGLRAGGVGKGFRFQPGTKGGERSRIGGTRVLIPSPRIMEEARCHPPPAPLRGLRSSEDVSEHARHAEATVGGLREGGSRAKNAPFHPRPLLPFQEGSRRRSPRRKHTPGTGISRNLEWARERRFRSILVFRNICVLLVASLFTGLSICIDH